MRILKCIVLLLIFMLQPICAEGQVVNKVVAVVNDEIITQQDVDQLLAVLYAQYVHGYKGEELLEKMEEVKKDLLKQMIEDRLILSRAKELVIKVTESEVNEKLGFVKNGFASEQEFYDTLEAQGITIGNLKDRYRDQLMIKKLVDLAIKAKVSVVPSEVSLYYEENRSSFRQDERYKVRHILIKAEDDVGFELAKVEIRRIYELLVNGDDFMELAKKYSQGPNNEAGGDMGYIERGEMIDELDEALSHLEADQFSEPIKSNIGYHILEVGDIKHSGYLSLEEVQADIKMFLFQRKFKKRLDEWVDELRSTAYISIK